jgi:hypothetical protein
MQVDGSRLSDPRKTCELSDSAVLPANALKIVAALVRALHRGRHVDWGRGPNRSAWPPSCALQQGVLNLSL